LKKFSLTQYESADTVYSFIVGILSSFSNYGEYSVDVAAPGEDIISTNPENRFISSSGTSMAAAFVSGEAALVLSMNGDFNAVSIKDRILSTSDRLSSLSGKILNANKINCSNAVKNLVTSKIIQINAMDYNNYSVYTYQNQTDYTLSTIEWEQKANYPKYIRGVKAVSLNGKI
jgi:subtilisin family serine protease